MSLVHQALRKAEQEKQRKTAPVPAPTSSGVETTPLPRPAVTSAARLEPRPPQTSTWLLPATLISLAAVAIVAIVVLVLRTTPQPPPAASTDGGLGSRQAEPVATTATVPPEPTPPPSAEGRPELIPPPVLPEPTVKWKLTGISKDPAGNYLAIVNGSLRGVNEYVDGAVIKQIERDRVTLDVDGKEVVVRLF